MCYNRCMTTKPQILQDFSDVDTLDQPKTVEVRGSQLREGMVLVDELGCPVAGLDSKVGRTSQASTTWLINDFGKGGWSQTRIGSAARVRVVAV